MPRNIRALAAVLGLAVILPGCGGTGGGDVSAPTPVATPEPPVTTVVLQKSFGDVPVFFDAGQALLVFFETRVVGTLDITVDWTFASNDIDMNLFQGSFAEIEAACLGQPCPQEVATAFTLNKPETLTFANAAASPYMLQIGNFGTTVESVSVEVLLTTTSSAASISSSGRQGASHNVGPALGGRF